MSALLFLRGYFQETKVRDGYVFRTDIISQAIKTNNNDLIEEVNKYLDQAIDEGILELKNNNDAKLWLTEKGRDTFFN